MFNRFIDLCVVYSSCYSSSIDVRIKHLRLFAGILLALSQSFSIHNLKLDVYDETLTVCLGSLINLQPQKRFFLFGNEVFPYLMLPVSWDYFVWLFCSLFFSISQLSYNSYCKYPHSDTSPREFQIMIVPAVCLLSVERGKLLWDIGMFEKL